jgi:hypothetical protein
MREASKEKPTELKFECQGNLWRLFCMGRKRSNVIQGEFGHQLDFFDHMLDCVTLGTKPIYVEQAGSWPPYAEVISSRVINRDPRLQDEEARFLRALAAVRKPLIYEPPKGKKWCSHCGEWVDRLDFAENASLHDGLQKWCKSCANRYRRRMYYLTKESQKAA